ncbi:MAG: CBS domain-containing protein [Bdellovibrionales bacterium]|nr:CBS domain-containing protein [Bdellovibrionales bacterium]
MSAIQPRFQSARDKLDRMKLCARDIMSVPVHALHRDDSLGSAERLMQEKGVRHLPITDEKGFLVGLLSHRDVLRYSLSELSEVSQLDRNILVDDIPIGELMQTEVQAVGPETTLRTAALLMAEKKYGCLPVTEDGKLVGIVTEGDFLSFFTDT